jgi:hypothetical protein
MGRARTQQTKDGFTDLFGTRRGRERFAVSREEFERMELETELVQWEEAWTRERAGYTRFYQVLAEGYGSLGIASSSDDQERQVQAVIKKLSGEARGFGEIGRCYSEVIGAAANAEFVGLDADLSKFAALVLAYYFSTIERLQLVDEDVLAATAAVSNCFNEELGVEAPADMLVALMPLSEALGKIMGRTPSNGAEGSLCWLGAITLSHATAKSLQGPLRSWIKMFERRARAARILDAERDVLERAFTDALEDMSSEWSRRSMLHDIVKHL